MITINIKHRKSMEIDCDLLSAVEVVEHIILADEAEEKRRAERQAEPKEQVIPEVNIDESV